jgi:hypothetical protein
MTVLRSPMRLSFEKPGNKMATGKKSNFQNTFYREKGKGKTSNEFSTSKQHQTKAAEHGNL